MKVLSFFFFLITKLFKRQDGRPGNPCGHFLKNFKSSMCTWYENLNSMKSIEWKLKSPSLQKVSPVNSFQGKNVHAFISICALLI